MRLTDAGRRPPPTPPPSPPSSSHIRGHGEPISPTHALRLANSPPPLPKALLSQIPLAPRRQRSLLVAAAKGSKAARPWDTTASDGGWRGRRAQDRARQNPVGRCGPHAHLWNLRVKGFCTISAWGGGRAGEGGGEHWVGGGGAGCPGCGADTPAERSPHLFTPCLHDACALVNTDYHWPSCTDSQIGPRGSPSKVQPVTGRKNVIQRINPPKTDKPHQEWKQARTRRCRLKARTIRSSSRVGQRGARANERAGRRRRAGSPCASPPGTPAGDPPPVRGTDGLVESRHIGCRPTELSRKRVAPAR